MSLTVIEGLTGTPPLPEGSPPHLYMMNIDLGNSATDGGQFTFKNNTGKPWILGRQVRIIQAIATAGQEFDFQGASVNARGIVTSQNSALCTWSAAELVNGHCRFNFFVSQ